MKKRSAPAAVVLVQADVEQRVVRLSDPAFAGEMASLKDRLRTEPDFSKRLLREAGIINSKGRVAKSFGG